MRNQRGYAPRPVGAAPPSQASRVKATMLPPSRQCQHVVAAAVATKKSSAFRTINGEWAVGGMNPDLDSVTVRRQVHTRQQRQPEAEVLQHVPRKSATPTRTSPAEAVAAYRTEECSSFVGPRPTQQSAHSLIGTQQQEAAKPVRSRTAPSRHRTAAAGYVEDDHAAPGLAIVGIQSPPR